MMNARQQPQLCLDAQTVLLILCELAEGRQREKVAKGEVCRVMYMKKK